MNPDKYFYTLKPENIAAEPREVRLGRRDFGRMLVVKRRERTQIHSRVLTLPDFLKSGDVLVLNDSRRANGVLRPRTVKENAKVELRIVKVENETSGLCSAYPTHHLRLGTRLQLGSTQLRIVDAGISEHKLFRIESQDVPLYQILQEHGVPITSFFYDGYWKLENYNTFYAAEEGSVESPMAGLHLTPELLDRVRERGVEVATLTLHVVGSWLAPLEDQAMMPEPYHIPESTVAAIRNAKAGGSRVLACGSTVVRALESAADCHGQLRAGWGESTLHISPGYEFRVVDMYFTNFHPALSSLIVLDSAFCDTELLLSSYEIARDSGYLFFEFGDAVLYI